MGTDMKELSYDAVVIGGGAAGMAAALEIRSRDHSVAIIEREHRLGGILLQCIHNGFGLIEFNEELTGPEFAENFSARVAESGIDVYTDTTVTELSTGDGGIRHVTAYSGRNGVMRFSSRAAILAMGCRERNRGNIRIPGSRPAGVYTAGLAQRLVNMEGYLPGKDIVIVGSGDIGLIMARRMTWAGAKVHAVVEILSHPSGLTRNIVQCLNDFGIPLYLGHVVSKISGKDRVEKVEITPLRDGIPDADGSFEIACDTVLLSVGLVPENELSKNAGIRINPQTNGAYVDSRMMTSMEAVFAAGNVLHVHDLVDYVTEESKRTGGYVVEYLQAGTPSRQIGIRAGSNVRYVSPGKLDPGRPDRLYLRSLIVKTDAALEIRLDNNLLKRIKKPHVQPSEMITVDPSAFEIPLEDIREDSFLEVSIQ